MATTLGRIVQSDCIKKLKTLDAGSVDLVFADPPFNIGYDYDEYDDKRSCEDYLGWSKRWISEVVRVLKPDGTFWLAIGDEYAAELKVMATRDLELTCRSWVVWYYTFGVHCKHKFTRSHAHLFYFVKDPKKFTFNTDDIRVPSARQLVYADKRANPKGRVPDDTWIIRPNAEKSKSRNVETIEEANPQSPIHNPQSEIPNGWVLRPQDLPEGFTADSDTWYFPRVCGTFRERGGFHGCQMPEQLLGRIIKACSNEGDLVVDPFAGSGTTLAVAKKLGRKYLGIEISKQYVAETHTRLSRIKPGDLLDGAEDPLTSVAATAEGTIRTPDGKRIRPVKSPPKVVVARDIDNRTLWGTSAAPDDRELNRAVTEAFGAVHRGYSLDWLLANSDLNHEFVSACERLSLPGSALEWNTRLLALRKAKKLTKHASQRAPRLDRERLRECEFASEIALSHLRKWLGVSLDGVLCYPTIAARFDVLAEQLAPGFEPVYYRWAALGLRKKASDARAYAAKFVEELKKVQLRTLGNVQELESEKVPSRPGVYVLRRPPVSSAEKPALYVGQSANLRGWVVDRRENETFAAQWLDNNLEADVVFQFARRVFSDDCHLHGLRSYLAGKSRAEWNYPDLGLEAA